MALPTGLHPGPSSTRFSTTAPSPRSLVEKATGLARREELAEVKLRRGGVSSCSSGTHPSTP
eukprot:CAMPEP_0180317106 /NCGR_PEP_ID=MMETSP0988-20121125/33648_1 /TAXON_ID=697907 /ORGANISM="non described non described, Strain CCMP2293" /LENGTH=61 /DNA_ID=CAMNT_0022302315 /DNA_START=98 /DNA_END=280 /DNA_ORIENTATION=+